MVMKQEVLDRSVADNNTLQPTVCQNFTKDNVAESLDFTATNVHWLSKADYKKKVGSLVIWVKQIRSRIPHQDWNSPLRGVRSPLSEVGIKREGAPML